MAQRFVRLEVEAQYFQQFFSQVANDGEARPRVIVASVLPCTLSLNRDVLVNRDVLGKIRVADAEMMTRLIVSAFRSDTRPA